MKFRSILEKQKRSKYYSIGKKRIIGLCRKPAETVPLFVFGKQRSGTTMLMNSFHLHGDIEIVDESPGNRAFKDYRIRSFETIGKLVAGSRFSFICFKPIADSHLINDFLLRFPAGRFIWIYRYYRDVANSTLRKFPHATRAIKIVCTGQKGGGWFQEGVSKSSAEILREVYSPGLTEFDLSCLVWWVRNRIFIEEKLHSVGNLTLIKYEDIVTKPKESFDSLFRFTGIRPCSRIYRFIHQNSVSKVACPEITPTVKELCEGLMMELNTLAIKKG